MMEVISNETVFSTDAFKSCFSDLFRSDENSLGPLAHILREYPVTPAKGGTNPTFADDSDMSYFIHVVNGCVIAGKMLEQNLLEREKVPSLFVKEIRLFFAAMVLHDINKLFEPGDRKAAMNLDKVFDKYSQSILKIVGSYLEPVGNVDEWLLDLKYLILDTEELTRELAGTIATTIPRPSLETIARYLKLGDQISGGIKSTDSNDIFLSISRILYKFYESNSSSSKAENLQFIRLPDIPQTLLRLRFSQALGEALKNSGRKMVARMPDSIIFFGPKIGPTDIEKLSSTFAEGVTTPKPSQYIKGFKPGNNKIIFDFARKIDPSTSVLDRFIELFNSQIILWSGPEWRLEHSDFPAIVKGWGIEIISRKSLGALSFKIQWYDEALDDPDIQVKRDRVKLACAKRMLLEFEKDDSLYNLLKDLNNGADAIQLKTNASLAFVNEWKDKPREEYNRILERLSEIIRKRYPKGSKDPNDSRLINYLLGLKLTDTGTDVPDKKDSCIQCGRFSDIDLKEANTFGFKPTSGGGKKVTKLAYDKKYNGKICDLCQLENELRKREFPNVNPKVKDVISIQIYLGDFVSPFQVDSAISAIENETQGLIDLQEMVFRLSPKEKIQLNYYALGFITKPTGTQEEFSLLHTSIKLISAAGLKIHISPLFNSEKILKPIFTWENSPGWVKTLGWNSIRIDQIGDVKRQMDFLFSTARMGRGHKDVPDCLHGLIRGPRGLLGKIWKYYAKERRNYIWSETYKAELRHFLEINWEQLNMTKMNEIVEAACEMVHNAPKTNNDTTWMIRTALDVYERGTAKRGVEIQTVEERVAGRLREKALRDPKNSKEKAERASLKFSKSFIALMQNEFCKKPPNGEEKRDIVAQFALMYHLEKWKRIMEKGQEVEHNE